MCMGDAAAEVERLPRERTRGPCCSPLVRNSSTRALEVEFRESKSAGSQKERPARPRGDREAKRLKR